VVSDHSITLEDSRKLGKSEIVEGLWAVSGHAGIKRDAV
jgi:hypothetical protein